MSWVKEEFSNINLGDKRLNDRFISTAESLALHPSQSINKAIEDFSAKKAAYRFFSNNKTNVEKIFGPHRDQTIKRISKQKVVLSIHDTSFLNYDGHKSTSGLGNIGGRYSKQEKDNTQGLILHAGLALTTAGVPIGMQSIRIWSREDDNNWEKESERWIEGLRKAKQTVSGDTRMIFITDREGDHFDLIHEAIELDCDLVIRNKVDRVLNGAGRNSYLSWHLENLNKCAQAIVDDPKNKRKATVDISYSKISFNDPKIQRAKHLERFDIDRVNLFIVEAKEENPPTGIEALHWILYTTLPVIDAESALTVVDYYRKRWHIESYFKVLKEGCCQVEECRLQEKIRLERYLTLFSIIAWRLYWMVHVGRTDPEMDSSIVLTESEQKTLLCHINKAKRVELPIKMTVNDAIRAIAKMGGHNGRKGDGNPGMITIWRGWIRLQDKVEMYEIMSQN